jgi:hypothetical protein
VVIGSALKPSPKFDELLAATLGGPVECVVEFEKPVGDKLWIQVRGSRLRDLSVLGLAFWESR